MRKLYQLTFLLFFPLVSLAQSYIPFPANMVIYSYSHEILSMGDEYYYPHRTEISSDTVIGPYHYSVVHSGTSSVTITGAIRNDIPAKKVYYYSFGSGTEKVLYDFNLSVGDTVNANSGYGFYDALVPTEISPFGGLDTAWVTSIDSVLMPHDGLYHKRYRFNGIYSAAGSGHYLVDTTDYTWNGWASGSSGTMFVTSLVEGVGQLYNPISNFGEFEYYYDYYVWCASINGVSVVTAPGVGPPFMNNSYCNQMFVGVEESNADNLKIYPNPAADKIQIENSEAIGKVAFTDVTGRSVLTAIVNSSEAELDVSGLSPGIYFIRLNDNDGNFMTKRIIKQ